MIILQLSPLGVLEDDRVKGGVRGRGHDARVRDQVRNRKVSFVSFSLQASLVTSEVLTGWPLARTHPLAYLRTNTVTSKPLRS